MVTPLFLALLVVETTDLLFALDSIPAVLAISQDPFLVFSSNACAILGLRSLFFLVSSLMDKFRYLKIGLGVILVVRGRQADPRDGLRRVGASPRDAWSSSSRWR